jgi:dsDNA-binding SOS-regulon protein
MYLGGQNVPTKPMYISIQNRSLSEIKQNVSTLLRFWNFRNNQDIPNPDFRSTPTSPLTFTNYGLNIKAKKTAENAITGYNENVENILFKKIVAQVGGPVYDIVKLAAVDGLPLIGEGVYRTGTTALSAFNIIDETDWGVDKNTGEKSQIYQRNLENIAALRKNISGYVPTSGDILTTWLMHGQYKDIADGKALWTAQSISNMIENRNAHMLQRFFVDYGAGISFVSVLDNLILRTLGKGPEGAKTFVNILNGDIEIPKSMKTKEKWSTGFDFWKKEQVEKSPVKLNQKWKNMTTVEKDKYLNKAFNSFMAVRLEKSTLFSPGWMQANTYTNRLNIGRSIPVHWQNIKLTERFAAAGGVFGQEMFGDWGYLPGALVTAIGAPAVLNRNWYNRARGTRIGSVALAPTEFGKGFYSGLDSLFYAVSKNRPLTERAYNKIANRLRKEGVPEGEIEKTVYYQAGVRPLDDSAAGQLQPFYVVDKKGVERLAVKGDKEYDILQKLADEINGQSSVTMKERQIDRLGLFLDMQNNIADLIQKDKARFLKNNPNKTLAEHPLNKLGGHLYDTLDILSTRSVVEGTTAQADLGVFVDLRLQRADEMYQNRREKLDDIGRFLKEFQDESSLFDIGKEASVLTDQIKNFVEVESKFLNEVDKKLNMLPEVYARLYGQTEFVLDGVDEIGRPIDKLIGRDNVLYEYFDELNLSEIALKTKNDLSAVEKFRLTTRKMITSIVDNLKYNKQVHGEKGKTFIYNKFNNITENRRSLMGNSAYEPFLTSTKQVGSKPISGKSIDNLFSKVFTLLKSDPEDSILGPKLIGSHSRTIKKIFGSALEPNGKEFRKFLLESPLIKEMYDEGGWSAVTKELGFDVTDNINIYQAVLNPDLASDSFRALDLGEVFGKLELTPKTVVNMHKSVKDKHYRLSRIVQSGNSTPNQQQLLNGYTELLGRRADEGIEDGTINTILRTNLSEDVYRTYLASTKIYAEHVAPHKYSKFNHLFQRTTRTNADLDDTTSGSGSRKQYVNSPQKQFELIGDLIIEDTDEAFEILTQQYGTRARVPTGEVDVTGKAIYENTYVLADADQVEMFRYVVRNAIHTHMKKRIERTLTRVGQKFESNHEAIKNSDELQKLFSDWGVGGYYNGKILEFSNKTKIVPGTEIWTGKVNPDTGKLVYSVETPFRSRLEYLGDANVQKTLTDQTQEIGTLLKGTQTSRLVPISTFREQHGKVQFDYFDTENRMFDVEFNHAVESNKKYQTVYKDYQITLSNAKGDIKNRIKLKTEEDRNNLEVLQKYLETKTGSQPTPTGAKSEINIQKATDALLSAPNQIDDFISTLANTKRSKGGYVLKGSSKQRLKTAEEYVEKLLKKRFVEEIMEDTGTTRVVTDIVSGKESKTLAKNLVPDYDKFIKAKDKYKDLLPRFLGENETKMYFAIAEIGALLNRNAYTTVTKSFGMRKILNVPQIMTVSNILAKGFAIGRSVVSPQYVGVDGGIRTYRKSKVDMLTAVLTSPTTPDSQGITAIEALYEVLQNNNYNPRYARALTKLLPAIYWESNVRATSYDWINISAPFSVGEKLNLPTTDIILPEGFETRNRYEMEIEGEGGLVEQPVSSEKEDKYRKKIIEDFGSMTGFRKAIEDGNAVALRRRRLIERAPKGSNNLKKELEALGIIK